MADPIITVEKAGKTFESGRGPVKALESFDLTVGKGEFVSIVGPSGCGKSTLLWAMAALWPLTSGSIKIYGQEVRGPAARSAWCSSRRTSSPGAT